MASRRSRYRVYHSYFVAAFLYNSVTSVVLLVTSVVLLVAVILLAHSAGGYATYRYLLGGVMGDFLGATICVTEILVLTLILILTSMEIPRTWEDVWTATVSARVMAIERNNVVFFQSAMEHAALRGHPVGALAHFIGLMGLTVLWCSFVGHPNALVRETVVRALPFWSSPMNCPPILAEK
jgi:uncharacterized membrane protein